MNLPKLRVISKPYLSVDDVARVLAIARPSARVFCARQVKRGELLRLKRNLYMLRERWEHLSEPERFALANLLQVPSYVSLMTALSSYGLTTQVQQGFVESVAIYRSKEVQVGQAVFRYTRLARDLYFGFSRREGYFIATPEKALADCLYLAALRRYHLDWTSLDLDRVNRKALAAILKRFPPYTARLWRTRWTP